MSSTANRLQAELQQLRTSAMKACDHPFLPAPGRDAITGLVNLAGHLVDEVIALRQALQSPINFPTLPDA